MSNEVVAATTTSFVFALIAVGLRLYARIALVKKLYGEDYILTTSFVVACSWWVVKVIGSVRNDNANIHLLAIISWYGTISWGLCSALTKLSIVYQYWRVFEDIRWVRQLCNYLMAFLVLYGLYSFLGAILMCIPVSHAWAPTGSPGASCADPRVYYYLTSSVNIFADLVIFALPVRPVLQLRIPLKQRLALLCCFTFGAFVIICSIVRLYWLVQQMGIKPSRDIVERVTIWAGIEMMTSIICTCFPVLRPLVTRWFPKLLGPNSVGSAARSRMSRHKHQIQNAMHQQKKHKGKTSAMAQKDHHAAPDGKKDSNEGSSGSSTGGSGGNDNQGPKRSHESESDAGERAPTFELKGRHGEQVHAPPHPPADVPPMAVAPMAERVKSPESRQEEGIAGVVGGSVHHQSQQQQQQQQQHGWNNKPYLAGSQQRDSRLPSSSSHHQHTASAGSTGERSAISPAPPYMSRTTSPTPTPAPGSINTGRMSRKNSSRSSTARNSRPVINTPLATQVPDSLRPGTASSYYNHHQHNNSMPVSPESTYHGSFRTSTVSALSHYPVVGGGGARTTRSSGSLRRSLVSSFNGSSGSRESAVSSATAGHGRPVSSSTSTPNLGHLYYAGEAGGGGGGGSQRASSSSSVYSRFSNATARVGGGWTSRRGFRGFSSSSSSSSGSLSSFGTSSFGTNTTANGGGGGSAMNTIVDREEEDDEQVIVGSVTPSHHTLATGVEDISATLDTAIATLQERSRNRGTFIELVPQGVNGAEVHDHDGLRHETSFIDMDGEDSDEDESFLCHTSELTALGPSKPWHERTPSSSKEVLAVQPQQQQQPSTPEPMTTTTTTATYQPSTSSLRYQLHPQPQLQAELEAQEHVGAELEAPSPAADISPVIPMPRLVLPPLFFQPEHVEYDHYRLSVSQPNLPSFMPPRRGLPALPQAAASRSELDVSGEILEAGGEEMKKNKGKKNRKSAVSPLGMFEMAA